MREQDFSLSRFFKHTIAYLRALLKGKILWVGDLYNRLTKQLVAVFVLAIFLPIVLLLLFFALGFGFSSWLGVSLGLSFLLAALVAMICCGVLVAVGVAATRKQRAKLLETLMSKIDDLDTALKSDEAAMPPIPLEGYMQNAVPSGWKEDEESDEDPRAAQ